jgi:hypothetical protein
MTSPTEASPPPDIRPEFETVRVPIALKVSAGLCIAVGLTSLLFGLPVSIQLIGSRPLSWLPLILNTSAALLMCAAAYLSLRARRAGLYCVVGAYAVPTASNIIFREGVHLPSILMLLAFLTLLLNWHELH